MRRSMWLLTAIAAMSISVSTLAADAGADRYQTLSELPFEGGYPTADTSRKLAEELIFQRAVQAYLWALPAVNMYAMKEGLGKSFGEGNNVLTVFDKRVKPKTIITTPNSDVIYGMAFLDLSKSGPLILDVSPKLQGLMNDMWHRPLTGPNIDGVQYLGDLGIPGPDKGEGGKYLIVPKGYKGKIDTKNYFVYTSPTNGVMILLRGFFKSVDNLEPGVKAVEGFKVYPLSGEVKPMKYVQSSDTPSNALFAHDASYFEMLDRLVQNEQIDQIDPYMHGVLASLGIEKGKPFAPSAETKKLLDQAALTGWKMGKNIAATYDQEENSLWWKDRHWVAHARTRQDDFWHTLIDEEFRDRTTHYTDVDAKAHMFINHYSISTGMMGSAVGLGAKYANTYKDSDGNLLQGANTYKIDLPANPPAKLFWSLTLYDAETAAGLDAQGQVYPSLNSMNDLEKNADGSYTFYVSPKRPEGKKNWIASTPGKGWFAIIRWYGPEKAFFERQYKPGDFVKVN